MTNVISQYYIFHKHLFVFKYLYFKNYFSAMILISLTSRGFNYRMKLFTYSISLYEIHVCDEDLLGITNNLIFFLCMCDVTRYPILQL
jgi:hypothetical protein